VSTEDRANHVAGGTHALKNQAVGITVCKSPCEHCEHISVKDDPPRGGGGSSSDIFALLIF